MTTTVAVVEDDVRILDALELLLGGEGWTVQTYTTGEAFLDDVASDVAPHCLILDAHLPGINGVDVAKTIINGNRRNAIPIIVLTARPNSSVTQEIMELGARAMLKKPVAAEELIGHVRAAVGADGRTA